MSNNKRNKSPFQNNGGGKKPASPFNNTSGAPGRQQPGQSGRSTPRGGAAARKRKSFPAGAVISVCLLLIALALLIGVLIYKHFHKNENGNQPISVNSSEGGTVQPVTEEKKYDENNVGEIYYEPVEPEHIAQTADGVTMYADNEVLVVSEPGATKEQIEALAAENGAEIVGYIEQTGDYQWRFPAAKTYEEITAAAEQLKANELVYDAYADFVFEMGANTKQLIDSGNEWRDDMKDSTDIKGKSWGVEAIRAPQAWNYMNQIRPEINPIRVGLVDGGFNTGHEDLHFAATFYDNGNNGVTITDKDYISHGTHVAGTMAADGTNSIGICGVYPYCGENSGLLYGASFMGAKNTNIVNIVGYKAAYAELILRNVKVINNSWGYKDYNEWYNDPDTIQVRQNESIILAEFFYRLILKGYDFVLVSSAGNDSKNHYTPLESGNSSYLNQINKYDIPDVYNRIIVVGAIDENFKRCDFSNAGERVDIFAPGKKILSTTPGNKYQNSDWLEDWSGTSMAAPHVAGVCADVWSIDNSLTGDQVKEIVCNSWIDNQVPYTYQDGNSTPWQKHVVDCEKAVREAMRRKLENNAQGGTTDKTEGAVMDWVKFSDHTQYDGTNLSLTYYKLMVYKESDDGTLTEFPSNLSGEAAERDRMTDVYGHFEFVLPEGDYLIVADISRDQINSMIDSNQIIVENENNWSHKENDRNYHLDSYALRYAGYIRATVRNNEVTYESTDNSDTLTVYPVSDLEITIADWDTHQPVQGAKVKLTYKLYTNHSRNGELVKEDALGRKLLIGENDLETKLVSDEQGRITVTMRRAVLDAEVTAEEYPRKTEKNLIVNPDNEHSPEEILLRKQYTEITVVDEDSYNKGEIVPISGADLTLHKLQSGGKDNIHGKTSDDGTFKTALYEGAYTIRASRDGYEDKTVKNVVVRYDADGNLTEPEIVVTLKKKHRYQVYDMSMTWNEAKEYCESQGGHLVTVTSDKEYLLVKELIRYNSKNLYWIGMYYDGTAWRWVTDEEVNETYWADGEPNNYENKGEGVVEVYNRNVKEHESSYGLWNDMVNGGDEEGVHTLGNTGFICEWD